MSMNWAENNHNYVPAYQQSGIPFVTSSTGHALDNSTIVQVHFPYVTRWVVVRAIGEGDLRVGFTENGVNGPLNDDFGFNVTGSNANYFLLAGTGSHTTTAFGFGNVLGPVELKCTDVFLRGESTTKTGFSLMAGYTNIPEDQFLKLTGSNGFSGMG